MTLGEAISLLKDAGIEDAAHDARKIFATLGGVPPTDLVNRATPASDEVANAVYRRMRREPLQYIIGTVNFYRESYRVSPDCLIPRQETELLVDLAVRLLPSGACFLDLCTGSGCIAVSTLKNTIKTSATAVDISSPALLLAEENAKRNGVRDRLTLCQKDALEAPVEGEFFAVLSNPPYVTQRAYETLEPELMHEPRIALVGTGEDGADFYRRITELYSDKIPKDGFILFEIGFDQADALVSIAREHSMSARIIKDYSGNDRMALLKHI